MLTHDRPAGVCVAALTPLAEDFTPDLAATVDYCRFLLHNGCTAINLLGSTGEATAFSVDTRLAVMEAVAGAGLPMSAIMVGTGAASLEDAVRLTAAAVDLGFAGALVLPPFYYTGITSDGLVAYIERLIERVNRPRLRMYLYHFPQLTGVPYGRDVVERLVARYPQTIVGLKDSSGELAYSQSIVAACPEIDVFPSSEDVLSDAREVGFAGCISATFNASASLAGRVWSRAAGPERASDQAALRQLRATIARYPLVPAVHHVSARLYRRPELQRMMLPLVPLDAQQTRALDAELEAQPAFAELLAAACA